MSLSGKIRFGFEEYESLPNVSVKAKMVHDKKMKQLQQQKQKTTKKSKFDN